MSNSQIRPLILITNDDGIQARGIAVLTAAASQFGDVYVVAPNKGYSGKSHSISVSSPIVVEPCSMFDENTTCYKVSGSPADCVKIGIQELLPREPDIVISGINHGTNASASVHYSGTLAAAREAALNGIRGIGFSLCDFSNDLDFSASEKIAKILIPWVLQRPSGDGVYYNLNVPKGEVRGIKICRPGIGSWHETYTKADDPYGRKYYWYEGTYVSSEPQATDTDDYWLAQGYATLCPCTIDACAYQTLKNLDIDTIKYDHK